MSTRPTNQHYVWQYYLRAWGTPKKIWCKRAGEDRPFLTIPRNVGSQRFFYEFHELTKHDLAYLEQVILQATDERLRELNRGWIRDFQRSFAIRREMKDRKVDPAFRQRLDAELRTIEKTLGERFHGATEQRAIPILDALRQGNSDFYKETEGWVTFIEFITHQYFRTSKLYNAIMSIQNPLPHDTKRTWPIEAFIYATNVGASLAGQRSQYRILFLSNQTRVPFITGDQPIINLRKIDDNDLDLFYPLKPSLALIYTANPERYGASHASIGLPQVERYNYLIFSYSDTQIYGNNADYLMELTKLPKNIGRG